MEEITVIDYSELLSNIKDTLYRIEYILTQIKDGLPNVTEYVPYIAGFLLFIVVCILLKSVYKFFKIFL